MIIFIETAEGEGEEEGLANLLKYHLYYIISHKHIIIYKNKNKT